MYYNGHKVFILNDINFEIKKIVHNGRTIYQSSIVTIKDFGKSDTRGKWMTINGAGYAT